MIIFTLRHSYIIIEEGMACFSQILEIIIIIQLNSVSFVRVNITLFCDITKYSFVNTDWRFRGVHCLYHQGDYGLLKSPLKHHFVSTRLYGVTSQRQSPLLLLVVNYLLVFVSTKERIRGKTLMRMFNKPKKTKVRQDITKQ